MGMRGPLPRQSPKRAASIVTPLPAPSWLPQPAVEVWSEIEPCLRARLRPEHADTLANWCATAAELRALAAVIARDGSTATGPHGTHPSPAHTAAMRARSVLLALGRPLGLDPASAARLEAGRPTADDPADEVAAYARSRDQPRADDEAAPLPPARKGHQQTVLDYIRRNRNAG